jgi:hypothetical protein
MLKVLIVVMMITVSVSIASETENYFHARYGIGENNFYENYFIFENNSIESLIIGTKIVVLDGLTILNPHILWRVKSLQFGAKYSHSSMGKESIGPSLRFIRKIDQALFIIDSTYYLDLSNGKNKIDTWLHISTPNPGLYFGVEVWHYKYDGGGEVLHLRPIKMGYRSKKYPSPFIMIARKWMDWKKPTDNIYVGFEIKY